jgi:prepilin-type N-terminal cleavage/methylation domain-containing protein
MKMSKAMGYSRGGSANRQGFTLVELLVVIAIIGVLAGLLLPALFSIRTSFNRSAVKFEVQSLADAFEKYRSKYGDYPPDGSSWPIMEAHFRKAFPNVLNSELDLLRVGMNPDIHNDYRGQVMDRAEALVFFLGGFSADSQRPFTGAGGPFQKLPNNSGYSYNVGRQNEMYEFPSNRLVFDDEVVFETGPAASPSAIDLLPVFLSYGTTANNGNPYVYFDARSYGIPGVSPLNEHRTKRQNGQGVDYMDVVRPMLAESGVYENLKTYQIASPGMDGIYGFEVPAGNNLPVLFGVKGTGMAWSAADRKFMPGTGLTQFRLYAAPAPAPIQDNCVNVVESAILRDNM